MIYLITSCTNAKKLSPINSCILRNYNFDDIYGSLKLWNKELNINSQKLLPARKLYKGVSWNAVLNTESNFKRKFETKLFISSAGYGLIDSDKYICAYKSTFAKRQLDSIHNFKNVSNATQVWWNSINKFRIDDFQENSYIIVSISYEYVIAMQSFLINIINNFKDKVFIILISQSKLPPEIAKCALRFDTRFNNFEKGTMTTLTQRCIRWLSNEIVINNLALDHKILQNHIDIFLSKLDNYKTIKRNKLNDEELITKINEQIVKNNINSATQGLIDLRKSNFACEQKRYGKYFKIVKDG